MPQSEIAKLRPDLSDASLDARKVWNAMGGEWRPDAIPVLVSLLDIEHVDGLIERLLAILAAVREKQDDELNHRSNKPA